VGGIGKTRLALAVAGAVASRFADGCWFAELAPATSGPEVVRAVAAAMGSPATEVAALAAYVGERQVLIVVDNCEHVLADATRVAQALVAAGPEVVIVATSREPLGLDGEVVRGVASLTTPDDTEVRASEAMAASAVRLFAQRASAATEQFVLDDANVAAVVDICRRLDGIPLAIELAAARVRAMAPPEIARRLGERFRLLTAAGRPVQERHRTLAAAIGWSHDLLSDDDKLVFRRVAVFPASFDLEAAERVADGSGSVDVVDALVRLVERSLVQHDPTTGRYRMLETLRQYGAERLADAGETVTVREEHTAWCVGLIEQLAPRLLDAGYDDAIERLMPELDNLRAAAACLAETGRWADLQALAHSLYPFLNNYALGDGSRWLRLTIDNHEKADQERVDALGELSLLVCMLGDLAVAAVIADESITLAERLGLHPSVNALNAKCSCYLYTGNPRAALDVVPEGQRVAVARGDVVTPALLEANRCAALAALGDTDASIRSADAAIAMAQRAQQGLALGAAVVGAAGGRLYTSAPDFSGARRVIEANRQHRCLHHDDLINVWFRLVELLALAGEPGGSTVSPLASCLRDADRLQLLGAVELTVRLLVYEAHREGHPDVAAVLFGYLSANLLTRTQAIQWLDERIEQAMSNLPADHRTRLHQQGAALSRRQLMSLVAALEAGAATSF